MKLCIGPQLDVTQVLKHFGVATLPNTAARAQKLAKLVPVHTSDKCPYVQQIVPMSDKNVPMSDKLSLCPTNCPYVQQKCSQSKTGGRRPPQPASYYKDDKVYLSKIIRKLYSKHVNIVTSNIKIWQWSWTIIEITSFFKFHWVYASIQIALTFVLVYLPFFVSIFFCIFKQFVSSPWK